MIKRKNNDKNFDNFLLTGLEMQRPFWGLNCKGLGVNNVSVDATCTEEQAESKRRYLPNQEITQ